MNKMLFCVVVPRLKFLDAVEPFGYTFVGILNADAFGTIPVPVMEFTTLLLPVHHLPGSWHILEVCKDE